MRAHAVQMHLHGSMSEGSASCMAHDHRAAETGFADVLWWTDHDFRVANFGKLQRHGFSGLIEEVDHPNRNPDAAERVVKIPSEWTPVVGTEPGVAEVVTDVTYAGAPGALRISLPGVSEGQYGTGGVAARRCLYGLKTGARYETFPLLTRPVVRIAVHAGAGVGPHGQAVIAFTLSEQPPDLASARLTYVVGGAQVDEVALVEDHYGIGEATVSLPFRAGEWNEYTLDLAQDVERLGLRGGIDNSLHQLRIGVASERPEVAEVTAHFGGLEVSVSHRGPSVLEMHRRMLESLPTRVRHHVGLEVSFYGRHITGFGSTVPIPDYEGLLPAGLTSEEVVAHIHRHGGLACLAHPPVTDARGLAMTLAERRVFGVDLMEVGHGTSGLTERLQLWDRLVGHGQVVTGIGVSDAHSAKAGWGGSEGRVAAWVTRIWAESDDERDLLDGLRRGHVFFADPSAFRGDVELSGPSGAQMGDVIVVGDNGAALVLTGRVTGLEAGDLVAWYANGALVHASSMGEVNGGAYEAAWETPVAVRELLAVRLQVHRPARARSSFGGVVACSNPIYLAAVAPETGHRVLSGGGTH